ncbi:hypothetical protein CEUSTIGMA_g8602.t1 [Chlamydomonas eustigma]|uniref:DNA-directed primase/polymerase protein n=1 Tax=Chlamydomonas eustigma TaxID=1157962 RepID=A0A250XE31_9CHLO|nr:hypothetical protein CEUSTIGMA_g8602.t1 [Chlamydomonas eustigma]|eukprot:GAX81169.1 hypothetical protein CEUSTIGMA_g8602.t1 [Chlamydomonas eustigma]
MPVWSIDRDFINQNLRDQIQDMVKSKDQQNEKINKCKDTNCKPAPLPGKKSTRILVKRVPLPIVKSTHSAEANTARSAQTGEKVIVSTNEFTNLDNNASHAPPCTIAVLQHTATNHTSLGLRGDDAGTALKASNQLIQSDTSSNSCPETTSDLVYLMNAQQLPCSLLLTMHNYSPPSEGLLRLSQQHLTAGIHTSASHTYLPVHAGLSAPVPRLQHNPCMPEPCHVIKGVSELVTLQSARIDYCMEHPPMQSARIDYRMEHPPMQSARIDYCMEHPPMQDKEYDAPRGSADMSCMDVIDLTMNSPPPTFTPSNEIANMELVGGNLRTRQGCSAAAAVLDVNCSSHVLLAALESRALDCGGGSSGHGCVEEGMMVEGPSLTSTSTCPSQQNDLRSAYNFDHVGQAQLHTSSTYEEQIQTSSTHKTQHHAASSFQAQALNPTAHKEQVHTSSAQQPQAHISTTHQQAQPHTSSAHEEQVHTFPTHQAHPHTSSAHEEQVYTFPTHQAHPHTSSSHEDQVHTFPNHQQAHPHTFSAQACAPECSLEFWRPPVDVFEVFPFQKEALQFCQWCNQGGTGALQQWQQEARRVNFESFQDRWRNLRSFMDRNPPPQQSQYNVFVETGGHDYTLRTVSPGCSNNERNVSAGHCSMRVEPYRVFTEEYLSTRQGSFTRHFVVTSYQGLWRKQMGKSALKRHWYEVIREDRPCHLYFDLEYSRAANPVLNGDEVVDLLIRLIKQQFRSLWSVHLADDSFIEMESVLLDLPATSHTLTSGTAMANAPTSHGGLGDSASGQLPPGASMPNRGPPRETSNIMMECNGRPEGTPRQDAGCTASCHSSTSGAAGEAAAAAEELADKFSRHLVVRAPGLALSGGVEAGRFVTLLLRQYEEAKRLMVVKDKSDNPEVYCCVVDQAVYSRMRHFRMLWNCKGGKMAVLQPTGRYGTSDLPPDTLPSALFLQSLICNVHPSAKLLKVPGSMLQSSLDGLVLARTDRPTLLEGRVAAWSRHEFMEYHPANGRAVKISWVYGADEVQQQSCTTLYGIALRAVRFVECLATTRARQEAKVRSIAYCGDAATVSYGMIGPGSHYCLRVGRAHRSNHVYFMLDFATGVHCQKCYDPDCTGFRSEWLPIPSDVWRPEELPSPLADQAMQYLNSSSLS